MGGTSAVHCTEHSNVGNPPFQDGQAGLAAKGASWLGEGLIFERRIASVTMGWNGEGEVHLHCLGVL